MTSWFFPEKLGVRIAYALAIALLPLGIISGLQSKSLMDEARARSTAALLGETLLAAISERQLIWGARVSAQALAHTIIGLQDDPAECSAALRELLERFDGYSYIAYIPVSGLARCTSDGVDRDYTQRERFRQMIADPKPDTVVIRDGLASGTSVLAFGHPVRDAAGVNLGYVSISMPHSVLESRDISQTGVQDLNLLEPITLITFDAEGEILTSSTGLDTAPGLLPRNRALTELGRDTARTFSATSINGDERLFAVFPLVDDEIYAIGSWPVYVARDTFNLWVSPYFWPAMMCLASLLVAILATERLVTRHIRTLRRSITTFATGNNRTDELDMRDAPVELRDMAESYLKMTDTILHDEAELENMVHQREVLLREVHHRVKNNLQLISSIINMQMRRMQNPELRVMMKGLQDRVMSLATIHRGLYQTSGLADVRADELLSDIVRQILKMTTGPGRGFDVSTHFDDLNLTPDQAVPLSLLLTEALTNAVKHAGSDTAVQPAISISLRRDGATTAVLTISNMVKSGPAATDPDQGNSLGTKLLIAFGQQLGAESLASTADGVYTLQVRFTVRELTEAEARRAKDPDPDPDPDSDQVDQIDSPV